MQQVLVIRRLRIKVKMYKKVKNLMKCSYIKSAGRCSDRSRPRLHEEEIISCPLSFINKLSLLFVKEKQDE